MKAIAMSLQKMPPQKQAGALLIEALVSAAIVSIALLGLVALQARAVTYSVAAEDRNRAALLANEIVATMWEQYTDDVSELGSAVSTWQSRVQAALPPYDDSVTASVSSADSDGVVTVTIAWTPPGSSGPHTYVTQVAMP